MTGVKRSTSGGEPDAKRARQAAEEKEKDKKEEEEEGDDDDSEEDEFDEDDDEDDDDEEDMENFDEEDFPTASAEELAKINQAFGEFQEKLLEQCEEDSSPLLIGEPSKITPLPLTVAAFEKELGVLFVGEEAGDLHREWQQQILCAVMNFDSDEESDDDREKAPEPNFVEGSVKQQKFLEQAMKTVEECKEKKAQMQLLAVLTDVVFNKDALPLWHQAKDKTKAGELLEKLGKCWRTLNKAGCGLDDRSKKGADMLYANVTEAVKAEEFKKAGIDSKFAA